MAGNPKEVKTLPEPKRDEFRQYLEKTGISEKLTKMILSLYEEPNKPENADEFISRNFTKKDDIEMIYLKNEVLRLRDELLMKNKEIAELKNKISKLEEEGHNEENNY